MDYLNMHATTTTFREDESIHKHWFSKFKFRERIELFIRKLISVNQNGEYWNMRFYPYYHMLRKSEVHTG